MGRTLESVAVSLGAFPAAYLVFAAFCTSLLLFRPVSSIGVSARACTITLLPAEMVL